MATAGACRTLPPRKAGAEDDARDRAVRPAASLLLRAASQDAVPCDVTRVALVGASHLDLHGRYVRSSEYINALRDFFRAKGFAVTLELGHDPDRDFVFMNGARRLLHAGRQRLLVPRRGRGARAGRHRDLLHVLYYGTSRTGLAIISLAR